MSWRKVNFGDLVENFSVRAKDVGGAMNLEFYGVSNEEGIIKTKYAAEEKAEDYKIIENECFAYNPYRINVGSIGLVKNNTRGLISPAYVVFKPKPNKVVPELLLMYLKSDEGLRQIKFYARGTVRQALRFEDLCKIELSLPEYDEQIFFFNKLKEQQEKNDLLNEELLNQQTILSKLRQQILQDAIQGKLVPQDPKDEPASVLLDKIKKEKNRLVKQKRLKLGKITNQSNTIVDIISTPKSWIWCKSDEVFFVTKLAGFEYTEYFSLKVVGEIPVIRAQNVRHLEIDKSNVLYIDKKTSYQLERCALTKKCLLLTFIGAGIGDVATFNENERWHLAPNVAKMEPFENCDELVDPKFINYYLISKIGQDEIFKHVKATAQPSLSMGTIRDIDLPLPPINEQHRIVKRLDQLMQIFNELEDGIKQNQKLSQQLLQSALKEALEPK